MVVQTTFRHMQVTRAIEDLIQTKAARLDALDTIIECRVLMDVPHRSHQQGNAIHVRVELSRPGEDVIVSVDGHSDPRTAIDDAFDVARQRLEDMVDKRRRV